MAAINREDIITDDALVAPNVLAENLMKSVQALDKFLASSKKLRTEMDSGKESLTRTTKATDDSVKSKTELDKIELQIAKTVEKNNTQYVSATKRLQEVKKELKDKIDLANRDRLVSNAQNSSITELGGALKANRVAYANLRDEAARNSKEGQELLKVIQQQDEGYKSLKGSIGQNQDKVGDYEGALKSLKLELKAAKDQLIGIAQTLGEDSQEFKEAAARAGQLKDQIDDINQSTKAVSGTPIENFGSSIGLLGDKLKGGDFKGAASAINGITASVKGLTFKDATAGVTSFITTLGGLGKALLTNPIFLLAAAIGASIAAFSILSDRAEKLTQSTLSRLDREQKKIAERYDLEISLARIAGKQTEDIEIAKEKATIETAKKKIKVLNDVSDLEYILATNLFFSEKKYNEEKAKQKTALYDQITASENALIILNAQKAQNEIEGVNKVIQKLLERFDLEKNRINENFDLQIGLARIAGKDTIALEIQKQQSEIKSIDEKIKGIDAVFGKNKSYTDEAKKQQQELSDQRVKNENEIILLKAQRHQNEINAYNAIKKLEKELSDNIAKRSKELGIGIIKSVKEGLDAATKDSLSSLDKLSSAVGPSLKKQTESYKDLTASRKEASETERLRKQQEINQIQEVVNLTKQAYTGIDAILKNFSEADNQRIDFNIEKIKERAAIDIQAAGDDAAAKEQIQKTANAKIAELEKQKRKVQIENAQRDKAFALVEAGIATALSVARALSAPPGVPFTIPQGILAGALGALQIAAIASKPIPKFAKGVENFEGGLAVVGEQGAELLQRGDKVELSNSKATLMNLEKGTNVIPHRETMKILSALAINGVNHNGGSQQIDLSLLQKEISDGNQKIVSAIKSSGNSIVKHGSTIYSYEQDLQGNKKLIRLKSFSE